MTISGNPKKEIKKKTRKFRLLRDHGGDIVTLNEISADGGCGGLGRRKSR